ncbi:MAG: hypothetical protein H0V81_06805 [Solirubrobacterales bacterium]|nr:hypothetical protein [Solirubrobacterales bacterium]
MSGLAVALDRDPLADLIPRLDGGLWLAPAQRREGDPVSGLVAGQATLDLDRDGGLVGVTVLEEPVFWERGPITWELPGRASPHRLRILEPPGAVAAAMRLDAARKLWVLELEPATHPELLALGPRSFAAMDGDTLVGLVADLRGFGRI